MSMRAMREELREARENRGAAVAVVVFTPAHAPSGHRAVRRWSATTSTASSTRTRPEPATLEAAVRLARLLALASLGEHEVEVDAAAIGAALTAIREQLEVVRALKAQLTSISNADEGGLDGPRHDALEDPGPRRRGGGGDPAPGRIGLAGPGRHA